MVSTVRVHGYVHEFSMESHKVRETPKRTRIGWEFRRITRGNGIEEEEFMMIPWLSCHGVVVSVHVTHFAMALQKHSRFCSSLSVCLCGREKL